MVSSEKENCLYISERMEQCIWKYNIEQRKTTKWLTTDYRPTTLSVSCDGQLLVINETSSILMIYGSEADILSSIQLQSDIQNPRHAIITSIGNFVILHQCVKKVEEGNTESRGNTMELQWVVSEITRDGQLVIRRFIPPNEIQRLNDPQYLAIAPDGRVFVADTGNNRVISLDSNLKWNQLQYERRFPRPWYLCYYEKHKQLFVGCDLYVGGNVYTFQSF